MITKTNFLTVGQRVQSFGNKYKDDEILNNTDFYEDAEQYTKKNKAAIKKQKLPNYMINFWDKDFYQDGIKQIKSIEKEFLSEKNPVNYDNLKIVNYCIGDSPEEKLLNGIFHPDIYLFNDKPYTGISVNKFEDGSAIYNKFDKGELKMTFMKNPQTGFSGFTDEVNECSKYYKSTNNKKALLISKFDNGVNNVKLYDITPNGAFFKSYTAIDDMQDSETKKLISDVNKAFGEDYFDDSYYIFA